MDWADRRERWQVRYTGEGESLESKLSDSLKEVSWTDSCDSEQVCMTERPMQPDGSEGTAEDSALSSDTHTPGLPVPSANKNCNPEAPQNGRWAYMHTCMGASAWVKLGQRITLIGYSNAKKSFGRVQ